MKYIDTVLNNTSSKYLRALNAGALNSFINKLSNSLGTLFKGVFIGNPDDRDGIASFSLQNSIV